MFELSTTISRYQQRVRSWVVQCLGVEHANDQVVRNHRFLEEALELVQANGCSIEEVRRILEYVYNRPPGEITQEVGGVAVTLAAFCAAKRISMEKCALEELERINRPGVMIMIRERQAAKPKFT